MATKIRLQRHGKKSRPIYHIVTADERAKRDGRYIEKLGLYNPNTNPATIDLNFERALHWVQVGAQPTDTARALLSYKGVLMMKHLLDGVKKGALTEEQAEEKFNNWLADKENRINNKREGLSKAASDARSKQLAAEAEVSNKRAAAQTAAVNAAKAEEAAAIAKEESAEEEEPKVETIEDAAEAAKNEEA